MGCTLAIALPVALFLLWLLAEKLCRAASKEPNTEVADLSSEGGSGFFQAMLAQYLAIDSLHWSHINTLTAIQGATLVGGYALWADSEPYLAATLLAIGFTLTVGLRLIVERTKQVRDVNNKLLKRVGRKLNPDWVLNPKWNKVVGYNRPVKVRGDHVVSFGIILLLLSDLVFIWFVLTEVKGYG